MAIGVYGTVRASDVSFEDIDIFYNFTPNRETENNEIFRLDPTDVLTELTLGEDDELFQDGQENLLEGLYNLRLPATIFNEIGIYTIFIKPRTHILEIADCNVLSSLPTIKGIVVNRNDLPERLGVNNAIQGYRIEYIDEEGDKIRNLSRYVVTSNRVVPVNENVGNTNQSSTRYRFDETGTLMFLQLTPSTTPNVKPNQRPFIGNPGDVIKISNTFFTPVVIEVDLVENTVQSLTNLLMGEQIKDVNNGILTYYDENREIMKQYNLYQIKDQVGDVPLFEVKEIRDNIDVNQDFDDITDI